MTKHAEETNDERRFPVQSKITPSIPWAMIAPHEAQMRINHDQSLETLARRSGLSAYETVCVLNDRMWKMESQATAEDDLIALLECWESQHG